MLCKAITGGSVTVSEIDGSPSATGVAQIQFNNGSLTDLGSGVVKVQFPFNFDGGNFADTYIASQADWDGGSF